MRMSRAILMASLLLLTGCGVETAGTTAVQTSLEAQQVEQGRQIQQGVQERLEAAQQLQLQRQDEQAKAAGN